jgi:hypothetical protein
MKTIQLKRLWATLAMAVLMAVVMALPAVANAQPTDGSTAYQGLLADGVTNYNIRVPAAWNGTLFANLDYNDTGVAERWLLDHGYALAGTTRGPANWDLQRAAAGLIETLDTFNRTVRFPRRTIVWGASRGGVVARTALQEYPDRFDGGLPMCGGGAGTISMWNVKLDAAFALDTLLAPGFGEKLQLTHLSDPARESQALGRIVQNAQLTPLGRARVALAASFARVPTWTTAAQPEPAPNDYAAQQANQASMLAFAIGSSFQAFMEGLAGGAFLWNHGVDYRHQLERSGTAQQVRALYAQAGGDLDADLRTLERTPRLHANPHAVSFIERHNITWTGRIRQPVFTMLTTGDPAGPISDEDVYADVVRHAGRQHLLRNTFVQRGGHCNFTGAEKLAGVLTLVERIETGRWGSTSAHGLNALASRLAAERPELGTTRFAPMAAPEHLRPWDVRDWDSYGRSCERGRERDGREQRGRCNKER